MPDALDQLPDDVAAAAFRRLVRHLQHRHDAQNIDLMGLSGFCRNCLADWTLQTEGAASRIHTTLRKAMLAAALRDARARSLTLLAAYEAAVTWCEPAPKARFVCTDADDQKFIDLAVAHRAALVSKDKAVLRLQKRLATLGVPVTVVLVSALLLQAGEKARG